MRVKKDGQRQLTFGGSQLKITQEFYSRYRAIHEILEQVPEILTRVHRDFEKFYGKSKKGRRSRCTSEQVLRIILVMQIEAATLREAVVRIDDSPTLRDFVGIGVDPMIDYTTLDKMYKAIQPETWQYINEALGRWAVENDEIDGSKVRLDTTVYETNVHYPTDSSLLWDSYRVLARLIARAREVAPELVGSSRLSTARIKKLCLGISRATKNGGRLGRRVKRLYSRVIDGVCKVTGWATTIAETIADALSADELSHELAGLLQEISREIESLLPAIEAVIDQARRRTQLGEGVPNSEKIFSIFEPHTELIKKGKAGKPVEFGHVVAFQQVEGKFITGYEVFEEKPLDADYIDDALEKHQRLFGSLPESLAADKGFFGSRDKLAELEATIPHVSIGKRGKLTVADREREHHPMFRELQKFRAGIEGTISFLKRSLKLTRCLYRSFKTYAATVGCLVFAHNLLVLARG